MVVTRLAGSQLDLPFLSECYPDSAAPSFSSRCLSEAELFSESQYAATAHPSTSESQFFVQSALSRISPDLESPSVRSAGM